MIDELPTLAPDTPDLRLAPMRGRAGNHILVNVPLQLLSPIRAESQASGWRTEGERCWLSSESGSMPCIHERMARFRLVVELPVQSSSVRTAIKRGTRGRALLLASDSLIIEADLGH